MPNNHSSLGIHSSDFVDFLKKLRFRATADLFDLDSAPKSTKSPTSHTALARSTSPYLQNTRIVDSVSLESHNNYKNALTPSLREGEATAAKQGKAAASQVDSTFCHIERNEVSKILKSKNTQSTQNLKMLHNLCSQRFTKADFKDYATLHKTIFKFQH